MAAHKENIPLTRDKTPGVLRPNRGMSRIPLPTTSHKKTRVILQETKLNTNSSTVHNTATKTTSEADEVSDKYTDIPPIIDEFVADPNSLRDILNEKPIAKKKFDVRESIRALPLLDDNTSVGVARMSFYGRRKDGTTDAETPSYSCRRNKFNLLCEKMTKSAMKLTQKMCSLNEATPIDGLKLDFRSDMGSVAKSPSCPSLNRYRITPLSLRLPSTPSLPDLNTYTTPTLPPRQVHNVQLCTPLHSRINQSNSAMTDYRQTTPSSTITAFRPLSFYDIEDELVLISRTAPEPSGLSRDNCSNPIARTIEREYCINTDNYK